MNSFSEMLDKQRRLASLRVLAKSPGYAANQYLMRSALEGCGHHVALVTVNGDFAWLRSAGLVGCETIEGVTVARLTDFGLDVAEGRAEVEGVARREPGHG